MFRKKGIIKGFRKKGIIKGATMTEYLLLAGLIAGGAVLAMTPVGTALASFFSDLASVVNDIGSNW